MSKSSLLKRAVAGTLAGATIVAWVTAQGQTYNTPSTSSTDQRRSSQLGANEVQKVNKGSHFIGMEVKNPQGEKLGTIKDVVIDFNADKIAYVVLATDKGAFAAERYHAVPLRAFQPSSDGSTIVLNADKDKLANAQGFSKDAWPSPSNPTWGAEPFWQDQGTSGSQYRPGTYPRTPTTPGTIPSSPETTPSSPGTTPDQNNSPK